MQYKGIDAMTHSDPLAPVENRLASDQPAITRLKQGDLIGLELLVQHYQVEAVHAALLIVHDRGTAEEVVQEAFLQVYRKIDQFDDRRPFGPWFIRSVINAAIKVAERQQRVLPLEEPEENDLSAEWLIHPGVGPEAYVETAETREAVWEAIEQLTPDQRAAVVLRYFLDEDENEMIQELNRPRSTVKWWLHAARQRLRHILRPFHASETGATTEMDSQEAEHE